MQAQDLERSEVESDEQLMIRYAAGDTAAFERLFARHEGPVYRFLLRSVRIPALADDLLQETWFSVVFRAACVWRSDCSALRAEALVRIEDIRVLLSVKSRKSVTFRICTETTKRPYAFSP